MFIYFLVLVFYFFVDQVKLRYHLCLGNAVGASPTSGMQLEQKLNQVISKDEPLSGCSLNAERPSNSADGTGQDGLPRSREITNQYEKSRESSIIRSRPTAISATKSVFCQKCKDSGHATELCTIGAPQGSGIDVSAARSSREELPEGNKLKAAIHAALLRRPEIHRKKKVFDQPDELSIPSTDMNYEIASRDQLLVSNKSKNIMSTEGSQERQAVLGSSTSDSYKHAIVNNSKQSILPPTDVFSTKVGDSESTIISIGKHARELPSHTSTAMSVLLKTSAIPEYEYIWQ
jgi:hypothetical protein